MGGHTEVTRAVTQPVISVTGVGKVREDRLVSTAGAKPGQDILVTKWIGIEGTSIIAKEKEKELLERFSQAFVDKMCIRDRYSAVPPGKGGHRAGGIHHQPPHRGDSPGDLSPETGHPVIFLLYLEYRCLLYTSRCV